MVEIVQEWNVCVCIKYINIQEKLVDRYNLNTAIIIFKFDILPLTENIVCLSTILIQIKASHTFQGTYKSTNFRMDRDPSAHVSLLCSAPRLPELWAVDVTLP